MARAALAPVVALALLVAGCGGHERGPAIAAAGHDAGLPSFEPAPDAPDATARPDGRWLTARLRGPVALRARPGGRRVARLAARTEFGSPRVLSVVHRRRGWLGVLAAERANGRVGWIPASAAKLGGTELSVRVDRSRRQLELRRGRHVLRRMPVAVGRPGNETPLGRFAVTDRLRTARPDSPYGCCAIALTGHQPRLPAGWPGGDRLAIHATPQTATIGRAASLGCLRASTRGVRALLRRLPLGAPVFVVA